MCRVLKPRSLSSREEENGPPVEKDHPSSIQDQRENRYVRRLPQSALRVFSLGSMESMYRGRQRTAIREKKHVEKRREERKEEKNGERERKEWREKGQNEKKHR